MSGFAFIIRGEISIINTEFHYIPKNCAVGTVVVVIVVAVVHSLTSTVYEEEKQQCSVNKPISFCAWFLSSPIAQAILY